MDVKKLFFNQILDQKTDLISRSPFNAIILIVKFENNGSGNVSSQGFSNSAIDFLALLMIPYLKQFVKLTECLNSITEFSKESMKKEFHLIN